MERRLKNHPHQSSRSVQGKKQNPIVNQFPISKTMLSSNPQFSKLQPNNQPPLFFLFFLFPSLLCNSISMDSMRLLSSLLLLLLHLSTTVFSAKLFSEFIPPNFTASSFQFVDNSGAFLTSKNGTFRAGLLTTTSNSKTVLFSVIHYDSNQIIWSARTDSLSSSDIFSLTMNSISLIQEDYKTVIWSTPPPRLNSTVRGLQLEESGNLLLIDQMNRTIWQSFDYPSDTLVIGQRFPMGANLSVENFLFRIGEGGAVLQWNGVTYWKLSMETTAFANTNAAVSYMMLNETGLYLFGESQGVVVYQVKFSNFRGFRVARLDADGRFTVQSFVGDVGTRKFVGPGGDCQIPDFCGGYGLCTGGGAAANSGCSCSTGFHTTGPKVCSPINSFSVPSGCGNGNNLNSSASVSYVALANSIDYFSNDFSEPIAIVESKSACERFCSDNCSCLGYFYVQSSGSCYSIDKQIGSFFSPAKKPGRIGYIKVISQLRDTNVVANERKGSSLSTVALVLIPAAAVLVLVIFLVVGFILWKKARSSRLNEVKLGRPNSTTSDDFDAFAIPGLPVRFDYQELGVATNDFQTKIGSGGFGDVYKGTLPDKSVIAVKKITNSSNQGKKEFLTEIAIIGNIHHVNLVKLRGFCAQGRERLLVYEYMNRGSLDRSLFGIGPVLEWQERFDIALGTARGLAYLHEGCEHKIIHCDIKPENILLNDHFQVKISDFGLSKLLSPEQSSHFTQMRGTRGYLAPEWLTSSTISDKTDVYSYGMVLLELISGRKNCSVVTQTQSINVDNSSDGNSTPSSVSIRVYFPLFALDMHEQRKYNELADPRLEGRAMTDEIEILVKVALCCVHEDPMLRPSMANVVSMLEGGIPLGEPRVDGLNFLRFYGRQFAEASTIGGSNTLMLFPDAVGSLSSTTTGSHNSLSYMSSQQVSGPR